MKSRPLTFRVKDSVYQHIKAASQASNRSMSEEAELRLTLSFMIDEGIISQSQAVAILQWGVGARSKPEML